MTAIRPISLSWRWRMPMAVGALGLWLGLAAGCSGVIFTMPPGAAQPGGILTDIAIPNRADWDRSSVFQYGAEDIEIVGWFETDSASAGVTGRFPGFGSADLVGLRDSDYASTFGRLVEENDLDGMVNKVVDTQRWVLNLYFVRFSRYQTRLGGVGYRLRSTLHPTPTPGRGGAAEAT